VALAPTDGVLDAKLIIAAIREATIGIKIQKLIFTGDSFGLLVARELKKKLKQGVPVEIIVDAIANPGWQTQMMYFDLMQHGAVVEGWEPGYLHVISELGNVSASTTYKPKKIGLWARAKRVLRNIFTLDPFLVNKRHHNKYVIINSAPSEEALRALLRVSNIEDFEEKTGSQRLLAFVGGKNFADEYYEVGVQKKNHWRDQDVIVRGDIVLDMAEAFDLNMKYMRQIKDDRPFFLNANLRQKVMQRLIGFIDDRIPIYFFENSLSKKWLKILMDELETESPLDDLQFGPARGRLFDTRPRLQETYGMQTYVDSIRSAHLKEPKEILIANAYFVPPDEIIEELKAAARKGVKIKIITNSIETNDTKPLTYVARYLYWNLLEVNSDPEALANGGGIEIREWGYDKENPEYWSTMHSKYVLVGNDLHGVHSFNLDDRSFYLNSESLFWYQLMSVGGAENPQTGKLKEALEQDWDRSREITEDQAREFHKPSAGFKNPLGFLRRLRLFLSLKLRSQL